MLSHRHSILHRLGFFWFKKPFHLWTIWNTQGSPKSNMTNADVPSATQAHSTQAEYMLACSHISLKRKLYKFISISYPLFPEVTIVLMITVMITMMTMMITMVIKTAGPLYAGHYSELFIYIHSFNTHSSYRPLFYRWGVEERLVKEIIQGHTADNQRSRSPGLPDPHCCVSWCTFSQYICTNNKYT